MKKRKGTRITIRLPKRQKTLNDPSSDENDKDEDVTSLKTGSDDDDDNLNDGMNNSEDGGPDKSKGNKGPSDTESSDDEDDDDDDSEPNDQSISKSEVPEFGNSDGGDDDDIAHEDNDQSVSKSGGKEAIDPVANPESDDGGKEAIVPVANPEPDDNDSSLALSTNENDISNGNQAHEDNDQSVSKSGGKEAIDPVANPESDDGGKEAIVPVANPESDDNDSSLALSTNENDISNGNQYNPIQQVPETGANGDGSDSSFYDGIRALAGDRDDNAIVGATNTVLPEISFELGDFLASQKEKEDNEDTREQ